MFGFSGVVPPENPNICVVVGAALAYGVAETTHIEKYWEPPP